MGDHGHITDPPQLGDDIWVRMFGIFLGFRENLVFWGKYLVKN